MDRSLLHREVLPFTLAGVLLVAASVLTDWLLHQLGLGAVGRWLGIPGTLLLLASGAYSLRKRGVIRVGSPATLLRQHETLAWTGALLLLVHAGFHLNAWLPWLALAAMAVNVVSGLVGRVLLGDARRHLDARRAALREAGRSTEETERALFWDAVAVDAMKRWRSVHLPITAVFVVLALLHIVSVLMLWSWR